MMKSYKSQYKTEYPRSKESKKKKTRKISQTWLLKKSLILVKHLFQNMKSNIGIVIVPPIAAQKLNYYIVSFRLVEATPLCFLFLLPCFCSNNAAAAIANTATARPFWSFTFSNKSSNK